MKKLGIATMMVFMMIAMSFMVLGTASIASVSPVNGSVLNADDTITVTVNTASDEGVDSHTISFTGNSKTFTKTNVNTTQDTLTYTITPFDVPEGAHDAIISIETNKSSTATATYNYIVDAVAEDKGALLKSAKMAGQGKSSSDKVLIFGVLIVIAIAGYMMFGDNKRRR